MNRTTRRLTTPRAGALALLALLIAPAATATDGSDGTLSTPLGEQRLAALTESFDRDARRVIRESQADLRTELDASLREDFNLALASRRPLSARR